MLTAERASPADGLSRPLALGAAQGVNARVAFSHRYLSEKLSKCQDCRSSHTAESSEKLWNILVLISSELGGCHSGPNNKTCSADNVQFSP